MAKSHFPGGFSYVNLGFGGVSEEALFGAKTVLFEPLVSVGLLELSWVMLVPFLGHLGDILGPSWAVLRVFWAVLVHVGAVCEHSWGRVGLS